MTWFRIEASLRDHKILGVIEEELRVSRAEAAGLYVLTLAGFAEHEQSGRPEHVRDSDLEAWAKWRGRRGRFARLFRDRFIEQREGQRDPPGQIKGWWRQAALFRKQSADAQKVHAAPESSPKIEPQTPDKPPTNPRGVVNGSSGYVDEDEDGNGKQTTPSSLRGVSSNQYTVRCTAAANRGLRENPLVSGFNELIASGQDEPEIWRENGIPLAVAERAILHRSKAYRPRGNRKQPTTLGYFREAVREEWAREQAHQVEGDVTSLPAAIAESQLDEYEIAARRLERQESHHAG